ncbi:MAG TPA: DUF6249 domain-containing protein [Bacteroidota bacterium]|nr:DUF6249 domain-containing protein [Bacteroidota bacterium]
MHNLELLVPITMFLSIAFILFKFLDDRHRERMAIIDKGLVKEDVKFLYTSSHTWRVNPLSSLKWGMLATFVGLGLLISAFVAPAFPWIQEDQMTAGLIFFIGGIGLILFYAMAAKKLESNAA